MNAIDESVAAQQWGLPVGGSVAPTLHIGPDACAVMMPAALGEKVAAALAAQRILGPILTHLRTGRWTFITAGWQAGDTAPMWLFNYYTTVIDNGKLPLPREGDMFRAWVHQPGNDIRPRVQDIVNEIQRIGAGR